MDCFTRSVLTVDNFRNVLGKLVLEKLTRVLENVIKLLEKVLMDLKSENQQ